MSGKGGKFFLAFCCETPGAQHESDVRPLQAVQAQRLAGRARQMQTKFLGVHKSEAKKGFVRFPQKPFR